MILPGHLVAIRSPRFVRVTLWPDPSCAWVPHSQRGHFGDNEIAVVVTELHGSLLLLTSNSVGWTQAPQLVKRVE